MNEYITHNFDEVPLSVLTYFIPIEDSMGKEDSPVSNYSRY